MMQFSFCAGFSKAINFSRAFSEKTHRKIAKDLLQANAVCTAEDYLSFSAFSSLAVSIIFLALATIQAGALIGLAAFFLAFAVLFSLLLLLPKNQKKARASAIEAALPQALRNASVELYLGAPYEKILMGLKEYPALKQELSLITNESQHSSIPQALAKASGRVDSEFFRRACFELSFSYQHGFKHNGLRKLADEISASQNTMAKEFHAKLSFYGLIFVTISCVIPALFGAYLIIGSSFLEITFTPIQVLASFAIFFPVMDGLILSMVIASTPKVLA